MVAPPAAPRSTRPAPITQLRRAYWRQAIAAMPCPACGAAAGAGCVFGGACDCASCTGHDRCQFANRLHLARLRAWTHPALPKTT